MKHSQWIFAALPLAAIGIYLVSHEGAHYRTDHPQGNKKSVGGGPAGAASAPVLENTIPRVNSPTESERPALKELSRQLQRDAEEAERKSQVAAAEFAKQPRVSDKILQSMIDTEVKRRREAYDPLFAQWGTDQRTVDAIMSTVTERFVQRKEQTQLLRSATEQTSRLSALSGWKAASKQADQKVSELLSEDQYTRWKQADAQIDLEASLPQN